MERHLNRLPRQTEAAIEQCVTVGDNARSVPRAWSHLGFRCSAFVAAVMTKLFAYAFLIAMCALIPMKRSNATGNDDIPPDQGAAGLYHSLLQLRTTLKVLHIVAHPDDEDGAMLTYCARGLGARTMLFSVTRGEGGANLISKHSFDELGILRTLEHAESAKYYGVDVQYSSAADYGYSKTLDEALAHWGRDERVLKELVGAVRRFKPDIIVSRFRGDARDGHGHHQFAGVLAQQAFEAAADADRFPEPLLESWQTSKLYANNIRPEWRPEDANVWTLAVPTGEFNSVLGRSYAQVARHGLGFQRSQGLTGHDGPAGEDVSYYRLTRTALPDYAPAKEQSFVDGLDTSITGLSRYAGPSPPDWIVDRLTELQRAVDRAWSAFDPRELEAVVPDLIDASKAANVLLEEMDRTNITSEIGLTLAESVSEKEGQCHVALRRALGIDFEAVAAAVLVPDDPGAPTRNVELKDCVPGQSIRVTLRVVHRGKIPIEIVDGLILPAADEEGGLRKLRLEPTLLEYNKPWMTEVQVRLPEDLPVTRPTWRRKSIADPFYEEDDARSETGAAKRPHGGVTLSVNGLKLGFRRPLEVRYQHPEYGALKQPLEIVPRVSLAIENAHAIGLSGRREQVVNVSVRNGAMDGSEGAVALVVPEGWRSEPAKQAFSLSKVDEVATIPFLVHAPAALGEPSVTIQAEATCEGKKYTEGYATISARDLGRAHYYRPAEQRLHVVDADVPEGLHVGYVMGSGDEIPAALAQLGVATTLLDAVELDQGDLHRFDTIMIGIRAYAVRADLIAANARLLDYVHEGGNLVVFYQTPEFDRDFGPYPYKMGRNPEEVSEEDAQVTFLAADHPLLITPNRITPRDFAGWWEQRGSKFWQSWDEQYQPLFECHDKNQPNQAGGLLYAQHGRGTYIYCAYALYRQSPQGVPGAYRLLANLAAHAMAQSSPP